MFNPGEIVVSETGNQYEVMFGPYADRWGADAYLVKSEHGDGMPILASSLYAKPTDPRREVVRDVLENADNNTVDVTYDDLAGTVLAALDAHSEEEINQAELADDHVRLANARTANPDRTTAQLRRYTDRDGDTWEERPDHRLTMVSRTPGAFVPVIGTAAYTNRPFALVEGEYGPLTRLA